MITLLLLLYNYIIYIYIILCQYIILSSLQLILITLLVISLATLNIAVNSNRISSVSHFVTPTTGPFPSFFLFFTLGLRSFSGKVEMVSARMSRPARENPWMIQPWKRRKIEKRKREAQRSGSEDSVNVRICRNEKAAMGAKMYRKNESKFLPNSDLARASCSLISFGLAQPHLTRHLRFQCPILAFVLAPPFCRLVHARILATTRRFSIRAR